jgi:uncharacterized protein YacL
MDTKTKYVKRDKQEKYINTMKHFGYEVVATSARGNKVSISLKREETIPNYHKVKKLEKLYNRLSRFPVSAIVIGIIGGLFILPAIFLDKHSWHLYFSIISAILAFISFFVLFVGITLLINSKKMIYEIFEQGDVFLGIKKVAPYPENVNIKSPYAFLIRSKINNTK